VKTGGKELFVCLLLVAATVLAFHGLPGNDFIEIDDPEYITQNPHVTGGLTSENARWALTTFQAGNWHPLTWWIHMLDVEFHGLDAGGHHLTSLLFHLAGTLVLFLVLHRMTGAIWPSAFVAAVFALHPAHVESVAWACEKKDVVSALFWFLTMAAYLRYVRQPSTGRYVLVVAVFAVGLTAKQMAVTLPFVLLLLDYWPLERLGRTNLRRAILEKLPLLAVVAAVSIVTVFAQQAGGHVKAIEKFTLPARAANAIVSYATYLVMLVWPSNLGMFYIHPKSVIVWKTAGGAALLVALSVLFLWVGRRHRFLAVGWLWYVGTLVPVIGLLQVGNLRMADRYTYVPYVGIAVIAAWGAPLIVKNKHLLTGAALIALTAFATLTAAQVRLWKDNLTILEHTTRVDPDNYILHDVVGSWLARNQRFDEARRHYNESIRARPDFAWSHYHLGVVCLHEERYSDATVHFTEAIRIRPEFLVARYNLATAYLKMNRAEPAIEQYQEALKIDPDAIEAHRQLGRIYEALGDRAAASRHAEALRRLVNERSPESGASRAPRR
jgi:hypothetical protein